MSIRSIIFRLIIIGSALLSLSENAFPIITIDSLDTRTSLAGEWNIEYDDDIAYSHPDFDDSQWEKRILPGRIAAYFPEKYNGMIEGTAWIRKNVFIRKGMQGCDRMGLILGRISNEDEVYFNGVKIGATGTFPPDEFSMWNFPRHYLIPYGSIRQGAINVISVRIHGTIFFDVMGTLAITNYQDWISDKILENLFTIIFNYGIILIHIPLLLLFGMIYLRRRGEEEYLYYCLQLFFGLFAVLETCAYYNIYFNHLFRMKLLLFSWAAAVIFHQVFLHRIYSLKRRKIEISFWVYLGFIFIAMLFIQGRLSEMPIALALIIITTCIGFYNISCHISGFRKRMPYVTIFSILDIIMIVSAMHDGVAYLLKLSPYEFHFQSGIFTRMIIGYGHIPFFLGAAFVLIHRFVNTLDHNEDLIRILENLVLEKSTMQNEIISLKDRTAMNLTSRLEDKIRKAVEYVEYNYKSDISREGLAASVDIHPDNLGRMFIKYSGKKLGDYINELRIKDAARQLIETDKSIPDIAVSVGFENLRSFTRLFPKYMGMTPHNYRKKGR